VADLLRPRRLGAEVTPFRIILRAPSRGGWRWPPCWTGCPGGQPLGTSAGPCGNLAPPLPV